MEKGTKPKNTISVLNISIDKSLESTKDLRLLKVKNKIPGEPETKKLLGWVDAWNKLDDELTGLNTAVKNIVRNVDASNPEQENKLVTRSALNAIKTAYSLLFNNVFERQTGIINAASEQGIGKCFTTDKDRDSAFRQELFVKFSGLSLFDILKGKNLDLSKYLEATVKATFAIRDPSEIMLENNHNPALKNYPDEAITIIQNASEQLAMLSILNQDLFKIVKIPAQGKKEQEIFERMKENINITIAIRKDLLKTALSPSSPNFPALREVLEKIFDKNDQELTYMTLLKFVLGNPAIIKDTYRTAEMFASENNAQSLFYTKFAKSIKEFLKNSIVLKTDVPTIENFDSIFNKEKSKNAPAIFLEDIQTAGKRILSLSSRCKYEINPDNIEYCNSKNINKIVVEFLFKNDPTKLSITLTGEKTVFQLRLDTKGGGMEWQFLEHHNDPKIQVQDAKNAAILTMYSALIDIQKQAEIEHQERLKVEVTKTTSPSNSDNGIKKLKGEAIVWTPTQKIKPEKQKILTTFQKMKQEIIIPTEDNEIKISFVFPNKEIRKNLMKNIPKKDRKLIYRGIEELRKGVGIFKILTGRKCDGKSMYELKVGNYRTIGIEKDSTNEGGNGNKRREFEIVDIEREGETSKQGWKRNH